MTLRLFLLTLFCVGVGTEIWAQQGDSLRHDQLIKFDFGTRGRSSVSTPLVAPVDEKKWLQYKDDFKLSTSAYNPSLPFSIWRLQNLDLSQGTTFQQADRRNKTYFTINDYKDANGRSIYYRPPIETFVWSEANRGFGAGVRFTVDFDKFFFETFTKRGRMLRYNRLHANAWKNYALYIPTAAETSAFKTFNKVWAPTYALHTSDSTYTSPRDTARRVTTKEVMILRPSLQKDSVAGQNVADWYKRIEEIHRQDSIKQSHMTRKRKR